MASRLENVARLYVEAIRNKGDVGEAYRELVKAVDMSAYENFIPYIAAGKALQQEGEIEVDDDACVSLGEGGAYVAAWLWVENKDVQKFIDDPGLIPWGMRT
ncbi:hypothetical protein [Thioalkalivibrio thiocyanodenitrificans]|uniref:hypothetical protein n=1 Tax=Thioalkalivibrio thiocyanodenitrificans TaxID=243063 RepID=UPI0012EAD128|nr:hypothetical protein [Thioalkalivibrio thiocyanodenitrificans]